MLDVERWAELRREHFVRRVSIKELTRRTGLDRNTVRRALRAAEPPRYSRSPKGSKLDPFKDEVQRLLREDPRLPGVRVRELIEPLGYCGSKTIVDDYLRELRPLFLPRRTFQRTVYRPGELCQFDLWQPSERIRVGLGESRTGYVVVGCLGYSRAGASALVFSKQAPDLLWGIARCLWSLGGLPGTLVWDREGALHARDARPPRSSPPSAAGSSSTGASASRPTPRPKGAVERLQGYLETNFERGRRFANPADFQLQLDDWFLKANARTHKTLRARPVDRLAAELEAMAPLPALPDLDRRLVLRVPADPFARFDTNDYSLDPRLVGRRVELRVSQAEVSARALDSGDLAARHQRSFARHRTITALEHRRLLCELRSLPPEPAVETRPLARYDELIA